MKKVRKRKATGRTHEIMTFMKRVRKGATLARICAAIGATADETKYVASTCLRLTDAGHLKRRETAAGYLYRIA